MHQSNLIRWMMFISMNYQPTTKPGFGGSLSLYRAKITPYPDISHEIIARRALDRRKPFDVRGHNGYRDTLLWISVLSAATDSKVMFVSDNSADFAKNKQMPTELADDLLKDLTAAGHGEDTSNSLPFS